AGSGRIYVNATHDACALVIDSTQKVPFLTGLRANSQFIRKVCGWRGVIPALNRKRVLAALRPAVPHLYLWFLGVDPASQHEA
ncbi:hypothetical protein NL466_29645, partial [Klebsiella pneumoniae]|nr:hypothetical protein [Klebsiella pneumoniae]